MRYIAIFFTIYSYIFGFTIDEATQKALEYSFKLKSQEAQIDSERDNLEAINSNFYPTLDLSYNYSRSNKSSFISKEEDSTLSLIGEYNLFNGFADKFQALSKEFEIEAKEFNLLAQKSDIILSTRESYIQILKAIETREIYQDEVELLESKLRDSENFYRAGVITKSELLEVKVELSLSRQKLLEANSNIRVHKYNLESLIGESVDINSLVQVNFKIKNLKSEELLKISYSNRSELNYLNSLIESLKLNSKVIDSIKYPKLNLAISYNRYGEEFIPDGKENFPTSEAKASLNLNWRLFDGFKREYTKSSNLAIIESLKQDILDLKNSIKLSLLTILESIKLAKERIEVSKLSIEEAREKFNIVDSRYRNQLSTTTELLDAKLYLTQTKSQYLDSLYNLSLNIAKLYRVLER